MPRIKKTLTVKLALGFLAVYVVTMLTLLAIKFLRNIV